MTVTPGSLDYLYYNGVLDHIPYEAYEMIPVSKNAQRNGLPGFPPLGSLKQSVLGSGYKNSANAQNISNNDYLNTAMKGDMYGSYGNSYDSFSGTTNSGFNQFGENSQMSQMSGSYYGNGGAGLTQNGYDSFNRSGSNYQSGMNSFNSQGGMNGSNISPNGEPYPMYSLCNSRGDMEAMAKKQRRREFGKSVLHILGAVGAITGAVIYIKKHGKVPVQNNNNTSFWSKLNPKNWFKKANQGTPSQNTNKFWSKLNPKNWFKKANQGTPSQNTNKFWSKLNPKNWFKKANQGTPSQNTNKFWSKLNPKNWFKKANQGTPSQNTNKFWSKLNPKNWFKGKNNGGGSSSASGNP